MEFLYSHAFSLFVSVGLPLSVYLTISICLYLRLSVCLSVSIWLCVCQYGCLSVSVNYQTICET